MTSLEKHNLTYTKQDNIFVFKCKDTGVEYHHKTFAPAFARAEINQKIASESDEVIYSYAGMRKRGFCEFGIKDFCKKLKIPFSKTKVYSKEEFHAVCTARQLQLLELFDSYRYEFNQILNLDLITWNETKIATNAECSLWYACDVIKGRWKKGEDAIAANAECSLWYACDVIKAPFEKGEDAIAANAECSLWYACDVIKGRFEKGEDAIAKDKYYDAEYHKLLNQTT